MSPVDGFRRHFEQFWKTNNDSDGSIIQSAPVADNEKAEILHTELEPREQKNLIWVRRSCNCPKRTFAKRLVASKRPGWQ